MQNTLKPILIILGLVALGALVYVFLIRQPQQASLTRVGQDGTTLPLVGGARSSSQVDVVEFQKLLSQLNAIRLDRGVFSKEQYPILIDHTQTALIKLDQTKAIAPLGKQNPFQALDGTQATIILQGTPSSR